MAWCRLPGTSMPARTAHRNRSGHGWPVPEDSLDEFDPKEREEAVLPPIENTVVEDFDGGPRRRGGRCRRRRRRLGGLSGRRRRRPRGACPPPPPPSPPARPEQGPGGCGRPGRDRTLARRRPAPRERSAGRARGHWFAGWSSSTATTRASSSHPETFYAEKGDPFLPKYLVEAEDLEDGLLIEAEAVARGPKGPMVQKIVSIEGMTPADRCDKLYVQVFIGTYE